MLVGAKQAVGIPLHEGPSTPPDLEILNRVEQHIKAHPRISATVADMRVAVQEDWVRLQPVDFNKYIIICPKGSRS